MLSAVSSITKMIISSDLRRSAVWIVSGILMICGCLQFHHHDESGHLCMHLVREIAENHTDNHEQGSDPESCSLHLPSVVDHKRADSASLLTDILSGCIEGQILLPVRDAHSVILLNEVHYPAIGQRIIQFISFRAPPALTVSNAA